MKTEAKEHAERHASRYPPHERFIIIEAFMAGWYAHENQSEQSTSVTESESVYYNAFETFRRDYPGVKRGSKTEFALLKRHSDWKEVSLQLSGILNDQKVWRDTASRSGAFVPEWPHLQTWIRQRRWEEELNFNFESNGNRKSFGGIGVDYKADILRRMESL